MNLNIKCPVCKKQAHATHTPFCSEHCRQIDLGRWLKGVYVVPGRPEDQQQNIDDIDK